MEKYKETLEAIEVFTRGTISDYNAYELSRIILKVNQICLNALKNVSDADLQCCGNCMDFDDRDGCRKRNDGIHVEPFGVCREWRHDGLTTRERYD